MEHRRAGDFTGHVAVSAYDFRIEDFDQDRQIFGMGNRVIWPYAGLRDADGNLYMMERKFVHQMTGGLWIMHEQDGSMHLIPDAVYSARGEVRREFSNERHVYRDHLMAKLGDQASRKEQSFFFEVTDDHLTWQEGDLCDLSGYNIGPGLQALFLDDEYPWIYFSRAFWVTGTIMGKPVSGLAGYENCYWRERAEWKELPYYKHQQVAWSAFCNQYEDGSIEWGHFITNRGDVGALMIVDDKGEVITTGDFEKSFVLEDSGYIKTGTFTKDGQSWEFVGEPTGQMTSFNNARWGGYQAQSGVVRRVGDTRTPTYSFSWLEAFSDRIIDEGLAKA